MSCTIRGTDPCSSRYSVLMFGILLDDQELDQAFSLTIILKGDNSEELNFYGPKFSRQLTLVPQELSYELVEPIAVVFLLIN